ncbi:hypothetical protein [Streptomyces yunnanensis]|uniref:Uncharacterized protein n=1 Tax=Streptomyces yunnanensis TaxID=156453 RepID=A0A9X8MT95_9ACTN|nr:hypothetical protein [Streptomyces yunnanensis]SHL74830.1 hypothetical protein SAMN05216268_10663 [Streptomyces yunnanensis]
MFGRKTDVEKRAIAEMREADRKLNENSDRERRAGIRHETPEYQRLNRIANEKAAEVPRMFGGTKRGR